MLIKMDDILAIHGDMIDVLPIDSPYLHDLKLKKYPKELKDRSDLELQDQLIDKQTIQKLQ